MRQDKKRHAHNIRVKRAYKVAVKSFRESPSKKGLQQAYSALDKAAKRRVIKKGKSARLKSRLSQLIKKKNGTPKS